MEIYKSKKFITLVVGIAAAAALAVGAYAYFTSTGTGSDTVTAGSSTTWQVTTGTHSGGPLTPGGGSGTWVTIPYTVTNNSTGYQKLQSVAISVANADGTTWSSVVGCTKADFTVDAAAAGATATDTPNVDLAPNGTYTGSITLKMVDSGSNQDGCKNAIVPLYLSAS